MKEFELNKINNLKNINEIKDKSNNINNVYQILQSKKGTSTNQDLNQTNFSYRKKDIKKSVISPSIKNNSKVNSKEVSIIQTVKEKSVLADDEKKKNSPIRPINNVSISREEKNTINNKSKESKKENKNTLICMK